MNHLEHQARFGHSLRRAPFVPWMDWFLYSPFFPLLTAFLAFLSCSYSLELLVYGVYCLFFVYMSLFGRDFLPAIPLIVCCYIAPSGANNPGINEASVFWGKTGLVIMGYFLVIVAAVVVRLVTDGEMGGKAFLRHRRALLPGMLALGASYFLAGAGSGHYFDHGINNWLFALLQFAAVFLPYYFISGAVKWEQAPKNYLAWVGICTGAALIAETVFLYRNGNILLDGNILRANIFLGWGHYNNIGAFLTMMIPLAFQLACGKRGWVWLAGGVLLLFGVVLTWSRASMLTAGVIFLLCCLLLIYRTRNRWLAAGLTLVICGGLIWLLKEKGRELVQALGESFVDGTNIFGRENIYQAGLAQFRKYPIFGGTFFPLDYEVFVWADVEKFTAFAPPRWHNTVVQLLATGGVVSLAAYGFHRWQTIQVIWKKPTTENLCIALSVAALLIASLMDCHFFNVGPTLFYSMALAFAENAPTSEEIE